MVTGTWPPGSRRVTVQLAWTGGGSGGFYQGWYSVYGYYDKCAAAGGGGLSGIFASVYYTPGAGYIGSISNPLVIAGSGGAGTFLAPDIFIGKTAADNEFAGGGGGNGNLWTDQKGRNGGTSINTYLDGVGKGGQEYDSRNGTVWPSWSRLGYFRWFDGGKFHGGYDAGLYGYHHTGGGAGWYGGGGGCDFFTPTAAHEQALGAGGGSSYWGNFFVELVEEAGGSNGAANTIGVSPSGIDNLKPANVGNAGIDGNNGNHGHIILEYQCGFGYYDDGTGTMTCNKCPYGKSTLNSATSISECNVCDYGFYVSGSSCLQCTTGYVTSKKNSPSIDDCNICNYGFYRDSSNQCTLCPGKYTTLSYDTNSISLCNLCLGGYYEVPGDACYPCAFGYYREEIDISNQCTKCPGTLSTRSTASNSSLDCVCDYGTYFDAVASQCIPCPIGFYKDFVSNQQCTQCPTSSTTIRSNVINPNECLCDVGYYGNRYSECQACPIGYYKSFIGSASTCQRCLGYSSTKQSASTSFYNCTCPPGYTGPDGSECQACPVGYFKNHYGSSDCLQCTGNYSLQSDNQCLCNYGYYWNDTSLYCYICPNNTHQDAIGNIPTCQQCDDNSISDPGSTSINDCLCKPGYGVDINGQCIACPISYYKEGYNRNPCLNCPPYSITFQDTSLLFNCKCIAGYYGPDGGPCIPCPEGTYKISIGNDTCIPCAASLTTYVGATNSSDCKCDLNSYGPDGGPCSACDANSYKVSIGNSACQCKPGYYGPDNGACTLCPLNTYNSYYGSPSCSSCPSGMITNATGKKSIFDCLCSPGYFQTFDVTGYVCEACPIGTYSTSQASITCTPGHENSTTSNVASTSSSQCLCLPGNEPVASKCQLCGQLYFKTTLGNNLCYLCPPNSWSKDIVPPISCACKPNYEYTGIDPSNCNVCSKNGYWDGTQCTSCPANTISPVGLNSVSDCICKKGYYYTGTSCVECPYNTYKDRDGNDLSCTACPSTPALALLSEPGSTSLNDCGCILGYTKDGDDCSPCPERTYKDKFGNQSCTPCKPNSYSATKSRSISECICDRGYTLDDNNDCTSCQGNTYKNIISNQACIPCKTNEVFSGDDHSSSNGCVCGIGYYRYSDGSCVPCNIGDVKYFLGPGPCINPANGIGCGSDCKIGQRLQTNDNTYNFYLR
eukprot:765174-Hanusia_phi.AAC.1